MKLPEYLGKHATHLLRDEPFKNWQVERSLERDLKIIHYVFQGHGLELRCDRNENISVIFLFSDDGNCFPDTLFEVPFLWNREQVLARFGAPSKSGEKRTDPILGTYGPWDRFAQQDFTI